jgi:hypothetical protein
MSQDHDRLGRLGRLERAVRRQRIGTVALGGTLVLLMTVGQAEQPSIERARAGSGPRYVAGGDRLYRIYDNGAIEYLIVDFAHGSVEGIPGWALLHVDETLTRDRMGNVARRGR